MKHARIALYEVDSIDGQDAKEQLYRHQHRIVSESDDLFGAFDEINRRDRYDKQFDVVVLGTDKSPHPSDSSDVIVLHEFIKKSQPDLIVVGFGRAALHSLIPDTDDPTFLTGDQLTKYIDELNL